MIVAARIIAIFVALMLMPGLAQAHGPTRKKVDQSIEISASPDKVWAIIQNFGDMSWHPQVSMTDATNGNEKGSKRTIGYKSGEMQEEELSKYDAAKMSYSTFIGHVNLKVFPATNYSSTITVKPAADGKSSTVDWRAAFYRGDPNGDPPANLNDEASIAGVDAYIQDGLKNLKTIAESNS